MRTRTVIDQPLSERLVPQSILTLLTDELNAFITGPAREDVQSERGDETRTIVATHACDKDFLVISDVLSNFRGGLFPKRKETFEAMRTRVIVAWSDYHLDAWVPARILVLTCSKNQDIETKLSDVIAGPRE